MNIEFINRLAAYLCVNQRTVKNHLIILQRLNWCGVNDKSSLLFVRGFDYLLKDIPHSNRYAVWVELSELKKLKEFLFASFIANVIRYNEFRRKDSNRASKREVPTKFESYPPNCISCSALARMLNISISTAHEYKKASQNAGYIKIKKVQSPISLPADEIKKFRLSCPELGKKLIVKNDQAFMNDCDLITTNITIVRRGKKSKYIKKGYKGEISENHTSSFADLF